MVDAEHISAVVWKLAPSDITFLFDECHRCFYEKIRNNLKRPSTPFPGVFSKMDSMQKRLFSGCSPKEFSDTLPGGEIRGGFRVESIAFGIPGRKSNVRFSGATDTVLAFDDGTFGVADFKTAEPRESHIPFYGRQLHAYALCLENPVPGKTMCSPVTRLGLLCLEPVEMRPSVEFAGEYVYRTIPTWQDIPRDDELFMEFLTEVVELLESPEPPKPSENCGWCTYRGV
ncbi:MAG: PD-(D/E)XK nuclease family protein [Actinobacteria bacterium]|nr:PD-(D/E)XK nuclease family protein [Actinomycetota bacterium]MCL6104391.1 PD-(D/E)XK nuclease family protein [Actinomycetota bacterium]